MNKVSVVLAKVNTPNGIFSTVDSIWDTLENAEAHINFLNQCDQEAPVQEEYTYSIWTQEVQSNPDSL